MFCAAGGLAGEADGDGVKVGGLGTRPRHHTATSVRLARTDIVSSK
jgi:hypothetical protein